MKTVNTKRMLGGREAARLVALGIGVAMLVVAAIPARAEPTDSQRKIAGRIAADSEKSAEAATAATAPPVPAAARREVRLTPPAESPPTAMGDKAPPLKLDTEFASAKRIVPFAFNRMLTGPRGRAAVKELLPLAKKSERVYVRGRSDNIGDTPSNRKVAHGRAYTVFKAFRNGGVERKKLRLTYCTTCFVSTNDTEEGRRANRRVEVEMIMPKDEIARLPKPVNAPEALPPLASSDSLQTPPR